jgi:hypothetical protein
MFRCVNLWHSMFHVAPLPTFASIDLSCYLLLQVYGLEKLHDALLRRPKEKPLITV